MSIEEKIDLIVDVLSKLIAEVDLRADVAVELLEQLHEALE